MRLLKKIAAFWLIAGAGLFPSHSRAVEQPTEYDVKAAFLLNFVKFAEWPSTAFADADAPIAICIVGKDPFGRVLDQLVEGETVNSRKVTVRRLSQPPAPKTCQLAFLPGPGVEAAKMAAALEPNVLTVGEGEHFARDGGIIGFVIENRRVRFDINQAAAATAGLTLSSKLLSVARAVEK